MTSPTSELLSPNAEPTARQIKHRKPTKPDPTRTKPEVKPEEQSQQVNSLVKDILHHHYKDDPFPCNLLNQASVKITENTTNDTLELELEGTDHSVSSNEPITIRIEGAHELIMALRDSYKIKLGPIPTKWRHHDVPVVTDDKIDDLDEQCTKWIRTNVEYLMGLTGKQLALWKLHYKLGFQQHIDDKVFFAQIADQKVQVISWKDMYQLEQAKYDRKKQIYKRMELINNAADARELHWEANKHKEPHPFYHWFTRVDHPAPTNPSPQSSNNTVYNTPRIVTTNYYSTIDN